MSKTTKRNLGESEYKYHRTTFHEDFLEPYSYDITEWKKTYNMPNNDIAGMSIIDSGKES